MKQNIIQIQGWLIDLWRRMRDVSTSLITSIARGSSPPAATKELQGCKTKFLTLGPLLRCQCDTQECYLVEVEDSRTLRRHATGTWIYRHKWDDVIPQWISVQGAGGLWPTYIEEANPLMFLLDTGKVYPGELEQTVVCAALASESQQQGY